MSRARAIVLVVALALLVKPARAEAYFWAWLDDLSGPKYAGFLVELQVQCNVRRVADNPGELSVLRAAIETDRTRLSVATIKPGADTFFRNAREYSNKALEKIKDAQAAESREARTQLAYEAMVWKNRAAAHLEWAESIQHGVQRNASEEPGVYDTNQRVALFVPGIGFNYSICKYGMLERDRNFLRVNVGLAFDIKDDHEYGTSKMLTHGASYHVVASPWLTMGAGGGIATFLPSDRPAFSKWYVQPWMFDIRPGAWCKNADVRSPWRHFVYVRISAIVFPQGFEAGRFAATSPEYGPELVNAVGVHFDLTPVLRGRKGNW